MGEEKGSGTRMAGRIVKHDGKLYRFGQDGEGMYGRDIMAFRIDELSSTEFAQHRVKFQAGNIRKSPGAWNAAGRHHVDLMELEDGSWLAAMDGDSRSGSQKRPALGTRTVYIIVGWMVLFVFIHKHREKKISTITLQVGHMASRHSSVPVKLSNHSAKIGRSALQFLRHIFRTGPTMESYTSRRYSNTNAFLNRDIALSVAITIGAIYSAYLLTSWSIKTLYYRSIVKEPSMKVRAIPVNSAYSKYSILIQHPYEFAAASPRDRQKALYAQIMQYSKCPSVSDILVHHKDTDRTTIEYFEKKFPRYKPIKLNKYSRNAAFRETDVLHDRAIFIMRPGVLLRCTDLEEAFVMWRQQPENLMGIHPGLKQLSEDGSVHVSSERLTFSKKQFNLLTSGAILVDSDKAFPLYSSDEYASSREYVETIGACEDVLLSLIWASKQQEISADIRTLPISNFRPSRAMNLIYSSSEERKLCDLREQCASHFKELFEETIKKIPLRTSRRWWSPLCIMRNGCIYF